MSIRNSMTVEQSEPLVTHLIQSRAETGWEDLTTSEIVGELTLPTLICDPRGIATQIIVIAGGAASGKSTLAEAMSNKLAERNTSSAVISSDDFVRGDRGDRRRWEVAGIQPEGKYDFCQLRRAIGAVCANRNSNRSIEVP